MLPPVTRDSDEFEQTTSPSPALLGGIAALACLILVTLFVFQDDLWEFGINPRTPYQTFRAPAKPDYQSDEAWAALPGRIDKADTQPSGAPAVSAELAQTIDIFFVHGTTFISDDGWNAPIDEDAAQKVLSYSIPNQALAFSGMGRLFAPHYRQATFYAQRSRNNDARLALAEAYEDVRRAFRQFLRSRNEDRPFILVGHGQGGLHVLGLLQDQVIGTPVRERMIAALVLGHPVPLDLFEKELAEILPCTGPLETGCLISWSVYPHRASAKTLTDRAVVWQGGRLIAVNERAILCTNPLSWRVDGGPVEARRHRGALPPRLIKRYRPRSLTPGFTGAQCEDGILRVDWPGRAFGRDPLSARAFASLDVGLFYADLRANAAARAQAFLENRASPADE